MIWDAAERARREVRLPPRSAPPPRSPISASRAGIDEVSLGWKIRATMPSRWRADGVLHLHRLENQDDVAARDAVSLRRPGPGGPGPASAPCRPPPHPRSAPRAVAARRNVQGLAGAPDQDALAVPGRLGRGRPGRHANGFEASPSLARRRTPRRGRRERAVSPSNADLERFCAGRQLHEPALQEAGASQGSGAAAAPARAAAAGAESASAAAIQAASGAGRVSRGPSRETRSTE